MKFVLRLIAVSLVLAFTSGSAMAQTASEHITRFGLYVVSDDLNRAASFYEALFEKKPYVRTDVLVGFDVAGGLYAVVSRQAYAPNVVRGDNTIPYIRVNDIEREFARVRTLAPDRLLSGKIETDGPIKLFKFKDPDGNVIEFFDLASPP